MFPSAKHFHMLFGRAGFSEPFYKGLEVISSAVHVHVGGICLGRLALWLFPQLQRPDVPLCKDVLIWAFTLNMTRLLCKHEMNWMFLAFLNGELGEPSAWLILPPPRFIFSQMERWQKASAVGRWLTEIFAVNQKVHCLKSGAFPNSVLEE